MGFMALASDQLQRVAGFVSLWLFLFPLFFSSLIPLRSQCSIRNALVLAAHVCQMNKI